LSEPTDPSVLERLLARERAVVGVGLLVLCALAWIYLLYGAGMPAAAPADPMAGMDMPGMDMSTMAMEPGPPVWSAGLWAITVAMWGAMMVAMMTPSAAPAILLYARVHRHAAARDQAQGLAPSGVFAAGYLLVWLVFAVGAAVAQWALQEAGLVSSGMLSSQSRWLSGGLLIAAGLYQLSPLQAVCLRHCRSPAEFLSRQWRPGRLGALGLGVQHGAYCVGCCWALMLLLFVGGVMNLAWIAGLTAVVLAQKLLPGGLWIGRAGGAALIAWGLWTLFA
jgi:predicted metal-binding membrane protein